MKVVAINRSDKKGVPKESQSEGLLIEGFGLEDDAHAGNWHRQLSLLAIESIDKMSVAGVPGLTPGKFAENITTEGIELHTLPVGTMLKIGVTIHEVTQIGKECHQKCAIYHTVGQCVMPLEGIFTRVISGGTIQIGDAIEILEMRTI